MAELAGRYSESFVSVGDDAEDNVIKGCRNIDPAWRLALRR